MEEYKKIVLENGLRVILVPKTSTEVMTAMIMFGVGSRNETEENAGISHVLEHMYFKGTKKRPTGLKISEFIDSIGGEYNAFTGKENTGYYVKAIPAHLKDAFDFLSDILLNSLFNSNELEKEKNVIIEEINMYEDLPMAMVENRFEEAVFGKNALGRDIIGCKSTIKAVKRENLLDYQGKHYLASNAALVLAGNFGDYSESEILKLIGDYFTLPDKKVLTLRALTLNESKAYSITAKPTEQSHIAIGFKTVPLNHQDYFKVSILGMILGGSASSRMFEEVREKRGLAYAVKTAGNGYAESGVLVTQAGVPNDKVKEAIEAILNEYRKIKTDPIPEAELNKAKEIINGKVLIKFEDSEELAYYYASEEIVSKQILSPKEMLAIYRKITVDDILEVAKKYLNDDRLGLAYIGQNLKEEDLKKYFKI